MGPLLEEEESTSKPNHAIDKMSFGHHQIMHNPSLQSNMIAKDVLHGNTTPQQSFGVGIGASKNPTLGSKQNHLFSKRSKILDNAA